MALAVQTIPILGRVEGGVTGAAPPETRRSCLVVDGFFRIAVHPASIIVRPAGLAHGLIAPVPLQRGVKVVEWLDSGVPVSVEEP